MTIPWQMRLDLQIASAQSAEPRTWGVKDPVSLNYYELREEEFFVLNQLRNSITIDQLCSRFNQQFPRQTLEPGEFSRFLHQLVQQGLLVALQPGYGSVLFERYQSTSRRLRWQRFANPLAIRFRGFDPDKTLDWIVTRCNWLFSPGLLITCCCLIIFALGLVAFKFDSLLNRLPEVRAWLSTQNLFMMAGILGCVKVLHEFGHGLACKRFGGECHEMGLMFLVFTPCLYCNVTDVWMIKNKWKRMAVSAAGIAVEVTIAATCTILWWFSEPGLFHSICLNLMFVCGVGTLFFNGNPLLRYDGYFILSDWLEIPNLQQQSTEAIRQVLSSWYFGVDLGSSRPVSHRRESFLIAYGLAAILYRTLLTFSILWCLYYWLKPLGLASIAQAFAVLTIGLMIGIPFANLIRWMQASKNQIQWPWFLKSSSMSLIAVVAIILLPWPSRVTATALFDTDEVARIYVTAEGTLVDSITLGSTVESGQIIARLVDPRSDRELARLEGEVQEHQVRLDQLERRRIHEPSVSNLIPTTKEALHDFELQLKRRREDCERLVLRAPRSGIVIPATFQDRTIPGSLPNWVSTPLDSRNRGCFLRAGTAVCSIADRTEIAATLIVGQDDVSRIHPGQSVRLRCAEVPGQILTGKVVEIAALDIGRVTADLVRRANLPTRITSTGIIEPVGIWHRVKVQLLPSTDHLLPGTVGEAKISAGSESLLDRFRRWFGRTFPFR